MVKIYCKHNKEKDCFEIPLRNFWKICVVLSCLLFALYVVFWIAAAFVIFPPPL